MRDQANRAINNVVSILQDGFNKALHRLACESHDSARRQREEFVSDIEKLWSDIKIKGKEIAAAAS